MIHWTTEDAQMLAHVVDVMNERMLSQDGYTEQDEATMAKLEALAKAGPALTVTGVTQDYRAGLDLFMKVVEAELNNWVPNTSQRLLFRAGAALDVPQPDPYSAPRADCGPAMGDHAVTNDWISTLYVMRCSGCYRIFRA